MAQTPPQGEGEIMQHGLHHLIQHNAATAYPQEQYDEVVHLHPNYRSPTPDDAYGYHGQQQRYSYQRQHQDSGLGGIQYDYQGSMYPDQYSTPATSPPTPSMNSQEMLRTRSGLGLPRSHQNLRPMPESRSRIAKSPKPKREPKRTKVKAEKKVAKLEKPLSELTKDWTHVAVVDIEGYVNRSAEVRRKEVEEGKIPGKVKRPMNSFMLYRKAYQNRTKDWCLQNNHQVVSQVCGDSWPLEPDSVKDQFSEWARIERINHQNAHPGYKFSPTKPGQSKAAKRKVSEEPASEESDLDDYEWQGPRERRKKHQHRSSPRPGPQVPVMYPSTRSAYDYSREDSVESYQGGYKSLFQTNNPGVPLPVPYNQAGLRQGEYYQQTIQTNPRIPGAEDVIIRKTETPGSFLGLPGGQEFNMMNHYQQYDAPQQQGQRIDPSLLGPDQPVYENAYPDPMAQNLYFPDSQTGEQPWQPSYNMANDPLMSYIDPELTQDGGQIQDPHMHVLKGNQEGWHVESLDAGGEFDKWMDEETN
ncbi:hypothetical protein EG329_009316 [Mollisiaceae sp. DMI_Dod_QoI]|nr:hypothetical protein EG329_009316 [Helotiales sp. DMI_Dod_QoI]